MTVQKVSVAVSVEPVVTSCHKNLDVQVNGRKLTVIQVDKKNRMIGVFCLSRVTFESERKV